MILGIIIFQFFLSFFLAGLSGTATQILSPITWTAISVLLIAVIATSNTPILKGGAMAIFFGTMVVYFVFSNIPVIIFGLIIVPSMIAFGMAMADIGRG